MGEQSNRNTLATGCSMAWFRWIGKARHGRLLQKRAFRRSKKARKHLDAAIP